MADSEELCFDVYAKLDELVTEGYLLTKSLTDKLVEAKLKRASAVLKLREREHLETIYSCRNKKVAV